MGSVLRFGDQGAEVARLVRLLTEKGCPPRPPVTSSEPTFGRAVENALLYFQMTHTSEQGTWLSVDGVAGPATMGALEKADGSAKPSFLEVGIPKGIGETRRRLLETAVKQHGVREDSAHPNRGSEVDKFLPTEITNSADKPGQPWCCYFVSWVVREVFGRHLLGRPVASCWVAWKRATQNERWVGKTDETIPIPGDAFLILHAKPEKGWCTGHIGFVLQVAADGKTFNTVEGNCGDRVKIGRRSFADPKLRGFINITGDHPDFERGTLRGAGDLGAAGTR